MLFVARVLTMYFACCSRLVFVYGGIFQQAHFQEYAKDFLQDVAFFSCGLVTVIYCSPALMRVRSVILILLV